MHPEVKSLLELGKEKVIRSSALDGIKMSLREYAEKLRDLEDAKEKIKHGTLDIDQISFLLEDAHRILRNSQILSLSNISNPPSFLYLRKGRCPNCRKDVDVMSFSVSKTWKQLWTCECGAPFAGSERVSLFDDEEDTYLDEEHEIASGILDRVLGRLVGKRKSRRK